MPVEPDRNSRIGIVGARMAHFARIESYGVDRVELVMLREDEADAIQAFLARSQARVSVHCPMFRDCGYDGYALQAAMVDDDAERREQSLLLMERELHKAADAGVEYLVVHLQRPVGVLAETAAPGWDEQRALDAALEGGERLASLAERLGVPIHIENMVSHPHFFRPETYVRLFEQLPPGIVGLCFDVGHGALDAIHYGFDLLEFAQVMAPRIASFHLHNNRLPERFEFETMREDGIHKKHPLHPSQSAEDGWIDVEGVLRTVWERNPDALPTVEVHYELDTDRQYFREGLLWLQSVCDEYTEERAG